MKKFLTIICTIALMLCFYSTSHAAAVGSCTFDMFKKDGVRIIAFTWTSSSGGIVSGNTPISGVTGVIFGVFFNPDDTAQPTDLYDVTVVNSGGADVLMGVGANLPQADTNTGNYRTPLTADGQLVTLYNETLTPAITNAGAAKKGIIYIILND